MDIIDAKATCGCMNRENPLMTCTLQTGHAGLHHWRPYPNASSGSIWDDSLAASPHAERDATPTTEEVKTLREDMAEMYERSASAERHYAANRVDALVAERDAYVKEVQTLTEERDVARAARDVAQSQRDLIEGRRITAVTEVSVLRGKLEQAHASWKTEYAEHERTARDNDRLRHERDESRRDAALLRASLDATQAELEKARQAADEWAANAREYEHLLGIWRPGSGPAAGAKDEVPQTPTPCPHSKAKQVGASSFVVHRCKLADGHDGMCEPA